MSVIEPKIVTLTLNPAIDKRYEIGEFSFGSVMRVKSCTESAGGKGLNVARVLKLLGGNVTATGVIGGYNGEFIARQLKQLNIGDAFSRVAANTRTCVNFYDEKTGVQSEFLEPGGKITEQEVEAFYEKFIEVIEGASVVTMSGSCVSGFSGTVYAELISLCKERGIKTLFDSSGENLRQGLSAKPFLVKPNADEIACLAGKPCSGEQAVAIAKRYVSGGGEKFVLSLGEKGSVLVSRSGVYRAFPPKVNAVNTVGCGDSMIAAFALSEARGESDLEMLKFATAVSAANAVQLRTGYIDRKDVDELLSKVKIEKL